MTKHPDDQTFNAFGSAVFDLCGRLRLPQLDAVTCIITVGLLAARDLPQTEFAAFFKRTLLGLLASAAQFGMPPEEVQRCLRDLLPAEPPQDSSN